MSLHSLLDRQDLIDVCAIEGIPDDWRGPIMRYLDNPNGKHDRKTRVHATNYVTYQNELYRKGEDGLLLFFSAPKRVLRQSQRSMKGFAELISPDVRYDGFFDDTVIFGQEC
ncbi:hypothetical protein ACFXTO_009160 [Malus domestica]